MWPSQYTSGVTGTSNPSPQGSSSSSTGPRPGTSPMVANTAATTPVSPQNRKAVETPYGVWQRKLITDPECMPVAHDLKNFVDQAEANNVFENKSKQEKADILHSMLDRAHRKLMQTKAFRDLSEDEENANYDFLEKWVLGKVHAYTFGKSREIRQKDRRMYKHIKCLQFLDLQDLDFPDDSMLFNTSGDKSTSPEVLLEDAAAAFARIETVHNVVNKLICIDSGCRVIMDVIQKVWQERKNSKNGSSGPQVFGADDFMPLLIFTIIRSNPGNMWSNIEYIETYRTPFRKVGQQNYHFTAYSSAAKFVQELTVENLANCRLKISEEDFRDKYARLEEAYYEEKHKVGATVNNSNANNNSAANTPTTTTPKSAMKQDAISTTVNQNSDSSNLLGNNGNNSVNNGGPTSSDNSSSFQPHNRQSQQHQQQNLRGQHQRDSQQNNSAISNSEPIVHVNIHLQVERGFLDDVSLRFMRTNSIDDLRVGEVAELLDEYKRIASVVAELKQAVLSDGGPGGGSGVGGGGPNGSASAKHVQFASPRSLQASGEQGRT
ncbi:unnamed protein product [Amoebophrya sp. A120]|nr:unnamed protein product [Amoebophrya sp. A120]|eukprot:GSA120T00007411001.1